MKTYRVEWIEEVQMRMIVEAKNVGEARATFNDQLEDEDSTEELDREVQEDSVEIEEL